MSIACHGDDAILWLAAIVEDCDDAIVSKDLDGIVQSWNSAAQRLFGYSAEEIVGKPIAVLIPAHLQQEEPAMLECLRRGERIRHYETVHRRKDGSLVDVSVTMSPVKNVQGRIVGASKIARDITERKRGRELQKLLVDEMKHRVRNTLATVQAIAGQTMLSASNEERMAFRDRLTALAAAHDLLTNENSNRVLLRELVQEVLKPFQDKVGDRITVEGNADAWLDASKASLLAMGLHELATNAIKYGALSNCVGRVRVMWTSMQERQPHRIQLAWQEIDGPPVAKPTRRGFGSSVIERALKAEFDGVRLDFDPQGVRCVVETLTKPKSQTRGVSEIWAAT